MRLYTFFNGQLTEGIAVTQTLNGLVVEMGHVDWEKVLFPVSQTNPPEVLDGKIMRASIDLEGLQWHLVKESTDNAYAFLRIITLVPPEDGNEKISPFGRWYVMSGFPLTIVKIKTGESWEGLIRFGSENRIETELSDERYFSIKCVDGQLILREMPA